MATYTFRCDGCGEFEVEMPMSAYRHLDSCPTCGKRPDRVYAIPTIHCGGAHKVRAPGMNIAVGHRTPDEQEAVYSKLIEHERQNADAARNARRGTRRQDGEIRKVGVIPRELYSAMQRTTGNKSYWQDEGKKALKEHGLLFDS